MKLVLFMTGVLSTLLGFIGIFLPLLPTTPLLLLSLYCFSKSSNKFETWLINSKMYKKYLEDFVTNKSMELKKKILLVGFATTIMIFPLLILNSYIIKIIIVFTLIYLYYYFTFNIKTI